MTLRELGILLRSIGRVMLNSELTAEIHAAEELTGREPFRHRRDTLFRSQEAHRLLDQRPELNSDQGCSHPDDRLLLDAGVRLSRR